MLLLLSQPTGNETAKIGRKMDTMLGMVETWSSSGGGKRHQLWSSVDLFTTANLSYGNPMFPSSLCQLSHYYKWVVSLTVIYQLPHSSTLLRWWSKILLWYQLRVVLSPFELHHFHHWACSTSIREVLSWENTY